MGKTGNLVDGGGTGVLPVEEEATGPTRIPLGKTGGTPVPPTPWLPG
jgi:hypothetical protein